MPPKKVQSASRTQAAQTTSLTSSRPFAIQSPYPQVAIPTFDNSAEQQKYFDEQIEQAKRFGHSFSNLGVHASNLPTQIQPDPTNGQAKDKVRVDKIHHPLMMNSKNNLMNPEVRKILQTQPKDTLSPGKTKQNERLSTDDFNDSELFVLKRIKLNDDDNIESNQKKVETVGDQMEIEQHKLKRPTYPFFQGKDVNKSARNTTQKISISKLVLPTKGTLPNDLNALVDSTEPIQAQPPKKITVDYLKRFKKIPIKKMGMLLSGANQSGLVPQDKSMQIELPEVADYTERRPEQVLSQLSEIMMYGMRKNGVEPVEVQFGYGLKLNQLPKLFTSTNNKKSQDWLLEKFGNPTELVKNAAKNSKNKALQRRALKILFFKEQKQARLEQLQNLLNKKDLSKEKFETLKADLELAEQLRDAFLKGAFTVVASNTAKKTERHAEQNIADAMHEEGFDSAEIAGSKIRCEACSKLLRI